MIIVAFLNLGERRHVFGRSRACCIAKDQFNLIRSVTLIRLNIWRVVRPVARVERKVVVESLSTDRGEVDPDLGLVGVVDRVCEIDLVLALVDSVRLGRDLQCDAGVGGRTASPWFFVSTTWLDGNIVRMGGADDRNRPDVNIMGTVVGDDGLGLSKSDKGAQGEGTTRHGIRTKTTPPACENEKR